MKKSTIGTVLYTEKQIGDKAKQIASMINEDYKGEDLVLLGTLKGSVMWLVELMKHIRLDCTIDFITASSYGSSPSSSGVVKITYEPALNLYNKNVIIVEDIVDTGYTIKYLIKKLSERGPKSIKVCTLFSKQARRKEDVPVDYLGFEVEDLFLIGYGLDFDEKYRNLPYVSYLAEQDIENN